MARAESVKHPFTGDLYTRLPNGHVEVRTSDGRVGVFAGPHEWVSGEVKHADTKILMWVQDTR